MGKNKDHELNEVDQLRRELLAKEKAIKARCDHRKQSGKLNLRQLAESGSFECKKCGEIFNAEPISRNDLSEAAKVLHDAINQIRIYRQPGNEKDKDISSSLGAMNVDIKEAVKLYERVVLDTANQQERRERRGDRREDRYGGGSWGLGFNYESNKRGGGKKDERRGGYSSDRLY